MLFRASFYAIVAFSVLGACAAPPSDSSADEAADAVRQDPTARAFLGDGQVKEAIGGRAHPAPEQIVVDSHSFGLPVRTTIVATYVDATPAAARGMTVKKTVAATVRGGPGGSAPTVELAHIREIDRGRIATNVPPASKEGAISLFLADPTLQAALAGKNAAPPVAITLEVSETGGVPVHTYLVGATYDDTPPGMVDAQVTRAVYGTVYFHPTGAAVATAAIAPSNVTGGPPGKGYTPGSAALLRAGRPILQALTTEPDSHGHYLYRDGFQSWPHWSVHDLDEEIVDDTIVDALWRSGWVVITEKKVFRERDKQDVMDLRIHISDEGRAVLRR